MYRTQHKSVLDVTQYIGPSPREQRFPLLHQLRERSTGHTEYCISFSRRNAPGETARYRTSVLLGNNPGTLITQICLNDHQKNILGPGWLATKRNFNSLLDSGCRKWGLCVMKGVNFSQKIIGYSMVSGRTALKFVGMPAVRDRLQINNALRFFVILRPEEQGGGCESQN